MPATYTPLRYPGGKSQLREYVVQLISHNGLLGGTYAEPFAGGAGLAMALLLKDYMSNIIINDIDPCIYAFWHSILFNTEDFLRLLHNEPITIEAWHKHKRILAHPTNNDLLTLGFSTFFINRTSRSGILKGGVMGGIQQAGNYKMDCRFNKTNLASLIEKIAFRASSIELYNLDAMDFLEKLYKIPRSDLFVFIDPPYFKKGKCLYLNFYTIEDHAQLAAYLSQLQAGKWIVTYDTAPEIESLYTFARCDQMEITYTASQKLRAKEFLIYSPAIKAEV